MSPYERINTYRVPRSPWRRRFSAALPWVFVIAVAAGTMLPLRHWVHWPFPHTADSQAARDAEMIWRSAGSPDVRHAVDVIRTVDGDTFEARVHLSAGLALNTRVRLRGIDAPELKASCPQELQMAEAASDALRGLLREGAVTISNIGPDKYSGRVVADVATKKTTSVSAALLAAGHARSYSGGHRNGWCANVGK
ncbi:thermonuclease family protein [Bradyrhizobium sp. AUGA SZCCT0431]|uniref:thermonuclease family protein n=1 Tax=Bradyrhizobium sp. AUGA SZCCT0431 TaxID=2807674 RepID=UPI001BA634AA|nr:thermonuclease family protein [Bradyrhizobium sp. AUGA SZCCT0431]MBR1141936.1 thermonuclease family protein [Bradyrhizobium sp. AUGA SZCCT0431]